MQKVLIIVPCYNEEASLPIVLSELSNICLSDDYDLQILVINDCSTDETKTIAQTHKVHLLDLPINLGIGGAVQSGLLYALENNFDLAIQLDGDGQHPPKEIIKLINHYQTSKANVVIGSRFINNGGFQSSAVRRAGIRYFYWLNKIFTGKSIFDSTSGFRLFDKAAITLGTRYYPDDYPEPASLVIFSKYGLIIEEVPVLMSHRLGGRSSIRNFSTLYYCIKVTIAMFFSFVRKTT